MDASRPGEGLTVVVIAGAGARGAYEAAVMGEVLPVICPNGLGNTVLLGTSAGAINAALWAARATPGRSLKEVGEEVKEVWRQIGRDQVYSVPACALARAGVVTAGDVARLGIDGAIEATTGAVSSFLGFLPQVPGLPSAPEVVRAIGGTARELANIPFQASDALGNEPLVNTGALLDTAPLRRSAEQLVDFDVLHANVRARSVGGVGLVATTCPQNGSGGLSRVFLHLHPDVPLPQAKPDSGLDYVHTPELAAEHVLASAAIPVVFPTVRITKPEAVAGWYTDGGVRLNAPIAPAIALGTKFVVVISSHATTYPDDDKAAASKVEQPGIFDIGAQAIHATLADGMIEDLREARRINRMVRAAGEGRLKAADGRDYEYLRLLEISPPNGQLSPLAAQVASRLTGAIDRALLRYFARFHGGGGRNELVSYLLFERAYFDAQFELGVAHARAALAAFPRSVEERR